MTQETPAVEATAETKTAAAKPAVVRAPKLVYKLADGTSGSLLKYPFPAKAVKYPVKVNGAEVSAASTTGKGKSYTYLMINNTSFYVPGLLLVDAEVSVDFPEGYKFDDAVAARVSTYKPKTPKAAAPATSGDSSVASASDQTAVETAQATADAAEAAPAAPVMKAARRSK